MPALTDAGLRPARLRFQIAAKLFGILLRSTAEIWGLPTLCRWNLGSENWGPSTLSKSIFGVCLRSAGEIWGLSMLCRWNLDRSTPYRLILQVGDDLRPRLYHWPPHGQSPCAATSRQQSKSRIYDSPGPKLMSYCPHPPVGSECPGKIRNRS